MTLLDDLNQFTGTEEYHRFSPLTTAVASDGARFLARRAGAYWLLDVIASYLPRLQAVGETFAVATITRAELASDCVFTLDNGNDGAGRVEYARQEIEYTDFPFDELGTSFKVFVEVGQVLNESSKVVPVFVILLPSEH